ncbi:hypothetical protein ABPG72_007658 [Tetrahymena utriculariae]
MKKYYQNFQLIINRKIVNKKQIRCHKSKQNQEVEQIIRVALQEGLEPQNINYMILQFKAEVTTKVAQKIIDEIQEQAQDSFIGNYKNMIVFPNSLVFGVLLELFQEQNDRKDNCENDLLKKWVQAAAILLFVN